MTTAIYSTIRTWHRGPTVRDALQALRSYAANNSEISSVGHYVDLSDGTTLTLALRHTDVGVGVVLGTLHIARQDRQGRVVRRYSI